MSLRPIEIFGHSPASDASSIYALNYEFKYNPDNNTVFIDSLNFHSYSKNQISIIMNIKLDEMVGGISLNVVKKQGQNIQEKLYNKVYAFSDWSNLGTAYMDMKKLIKKYEFPLPSIQNTRVSANVFRTTNNIPITDEEFNIVKEDIVKQIEEDKFIDTIIKKELMMTRKNKQHLSEHVIPEIREQGELHSIMPPDTPRTFPFTNTNEAYHEAEKRFTKNATLQTKNRMGGKKRRKTTTTKKNEIKGHNATVSSKNLYLKTKLGTKVTRL
jgi:hypothetical protein